MEEKLARTIYAFQLVLNREHTMSGAGLKLRVKHTTVVRRIKALEGEFGLRLFDHPGKGYGLTPARKNHYENTLIIEE